LIRKVDMVFAPVKLLLVLAGRLTGVPRLALLRRCWDKQNITLTFTSSELLTHVSGFWPV
jgi:hypothetical protein